MNERNFVGHIIAIALAVFIFIMLISCISIVPSGYTGIKVAFSQIQDEVIPNGFVFHAPYESIKKVNNKQQEELYEDRIWGESSEQVVTYISDVTVSYRINPALSAWIYTNVNDYKENALPDNIVASAMKNAMAALPTNQVTKRAYIEPLAEDMLQDAINEKYDGRQVIDIIAVNIGQMDFEENYNRALEERQLAALEAEKQAIENQKNTDRAQAEADQKVIAAQAEADRQLIAAQAEADAIKVKAEAQAEANKKIAESITEEFIDYQKIQQWNGELPTVTGGEAFVGIDISK